MMSRVDAGPLRRGMASSSLSSCRSWSMMVFNGTKSEYLVGSWAFHCGRDKGTGSLDNIKHPGGPVLLARRLWVHVLVMGLLGTPLTTYGCKDTWSFEITECLCGPVSDRRVWVLV
jgi:hypothetical protein